MKDQLELFGYEEPRKTTLGHAEVIHKSTSGILTKASGFMEGYDFSLNPYSGCSFGCNYCYAAFFSRNKEKMDNWGYWVEVKENALEILKKMRRQPIIGKTIYMSSVTDPYQPIEKKLELTRSLLKEFAEFHEVKLVIQTRSSLVTRDIDLLKEIGNVQVNMTITTDDEEVRKAFEPLCPSNKSRLEAIKKIHQSGIQSCITMTPLLPIKNPEEFASVLKATGVKNFIIQPFHTTKGKFVAGTREQALNMLAQYNWGDAEYRRVLKIIQEKLPDIGVGKSGFAPPI